MTSEMETNIVAVERVKEYSETPQEVYHYIIITSSYYISITSSYYIIITQGARWCVSEDSFCQNPKVIFFHKVFVN